MQDEALLQKFKKFKAMIVSTNIPANLLLEMIENYLTSDNEEDLAAESIPVLDGQLSLFDAAA